MAGQATAAETEAAVGQQQSFKTQQRSVAAAPASVAAVVATAAAVAAAAAVVAATTAGADCSCGRHGHRPIYARGGASCLTGNQIGNIQRNFGYFWRL